MPIALSTSSLSSSFSPLSPEDEGKQLRLVEEIDLLPRWLLRSRKTGEEGLERSRWLVWTREKRDEGLVVAPWGA
jgi:hypothetical protein